MDSGLGDRWLASIHPDDLDNFIAGNAQGFKLQKGFSKEYRLRRRDGGYRWMLDVAAPRINGDGEFAGFIGSASDVTDQNSRRKRSKNGRQTDRGPGKRTQPHRQRATR
jgi:PAS domain S-box-containing protein